MSVKLTMGAVASNKPPVPLPSEEEYPEQLVFSDGREVWVSAPKPDRITLIAPLKPHHFIPQPKDDKELKDLVRGLSSWLATMGGHSKIADTKYDASTGFYEKVYLAAGERDATVFVHFMRPKKGKTPAPWKLRLEFNPRKFGPAGLSALTTDISYAKTFRIDRFLADCRLTRLDIAVDFIGVAVSETIPSASDPGKRTYYVGDDGSLETIQLHRNNPPAKQKYAPDGSPKKMPRSSDPLGPVVAKLYDRVRERAAVLQPPPFGNAPVTRAEIVKRWKGNGPKLTDLPGYKNLLIDLSIDYDGDQPPVDLFLWRTYIASRRTMPKEAVEKMMKLSVPRAILLGRRFDRPTSNLLQHERVWGFWSDGLDRVGLGYWLLLAAQAHLSKFEGGKI